MIRNELISNPYFRIITGLARVHDLANKKEELEQIIRSEVLDWGKLVAIFERQKVLGLAYRNLCDLDLIDCAPHRSKNALRYNYLGNRSRNSELLREAHYSISQLRVSGVDVRPLKGAVLVPLVYRDFGTRNLNDLDIFADVQQIRTLNDCLIKQGYKHGVYDSKSNDIVDIHAEDEKKLFEGLFNIRPYRKALGLECIDAVTIDVTYGLTFNDKDSLNSEVLKSGQVIGIHWTLAHVDFLIHLCTHLFKEATTKLWEFIGQDINIIKFCDIREYIHKLGVESFATVLSQRAAELDVHNEVSFALSLTASVYEDKDILELSKTLSPFDDFYAENLVSIERDKGSAEKREFSVFESLIRAL